MVEVCNESTEHIVIKRGTRLAAASVVPESAFENERMRAEENVSGKMSSAPYSSSWVDTVISAVARSVSQSTDPMPELKKIIQ
ncbi:hypothetical protein PC121_g18407 [Phytophthora cactorum]|nr:hypothetical protein PC121_g18407 [Phytophthora cactorum]